MRFYQNLIRRTAPVFAACMVMMMNVALWAQETTAPAKDAVEKVAAAGPSKTSWFQMFFLSDDNLGQAIIVLLLLLSVTSTALVILYLLQNRKSVIMPDESVDAVEELLDERRFKDAIEYAEEDDSVFGEIMHACLVEASNGYGAMERAIEETGDLALTRRGRNLEYLSVLGAVGPMIGLFGTVYGMIQAFNTIVEKGGQPNPEDLAAGISTALVTTFWGLIVGIPAVAAYTLIKNRLDAMIAETMILGEDLIGRFKPGAKPGAKSGSATQSPKSSSKSSSDSTTPSPKPKPKA